MFLVEYYEKTEMHLITILSSHKFLIITVYIKISLFKKMQHIILQKEKLSVKSQIQVLQHLNLTITQIRARLKKQNFSHLSSIYVIRQC